MPKRGYRISWDEHGPVGRAIFLVALACVVVGGVWLGYGLIFTEVSAASLVLTGAGAATVSLQLLLAQGKLEERGGPSS